MATDTNVLNYGGENQLVFMHKDGPASQLDSEAKNPVGVLTRYKGNVYRYVLLDTGAGPVATLAGAPAYWHDLDPENGKFEVTSDATSAIDGKGNNVVAGVFLTDSQTDAYYIWIQVGGINPACLVGASTAVGDLQFGGSDSIFVRIAQGSAATDEPFASALMAIDAVTTGFAGCVILNCDW